MRKIFLFLTLAMLLFSTNVAAQEAKFKAVFTLNFIRYIGWPETAQEGDFVIGVVRGREVASWMESQSKGKKFGFQDIVVKQYRSAEEVEDCQVIYVSSAVNLRAQGELLADKALQNKALLITEAEGATNHGAAINFVVRDGALKFELHKGNASRASLQFSSRLETMAAAIVL